MGAAWNWRGLCDFFREICPFYCSRLQISQLDIESGLMSNSTAVSSDNEQKKVINNF